MMISTKGRYALRVMIDLAEHCNGEYIPMKDVVKRQQVSQKYVERIMTMLSKANFVEAVHGKGGGYRLNRSPDEYIVGDILRLRRVHLHLWRVWTAMPRNARGPISAGRFLCGKSLITELQISLTASPLPI